MPDASIQLPPGPRLPGAIQSVIWFRKAQWLMETCQVLVGRPAPSTNAHEPGLVPVEA
ncbi:MAG TPA: hypothetical protein VGP18_03200 [Solirubrobacteraceae bacterium]|nr:hypothetical protein [Solirubrobacteraceae bacterium]